MMHLVTELESNILILSAIIASIVQTEVGLRTLRKHIDRNGRDGSDGNVSGGR